NSFTIHLIHFILPQTLHSSPKHQNSSNKPPFQFPTNFLFLFHHHSPKLIPNHLFSFHTLDVRKLLE
ncbi:unnamed protein product, partial [Prunus brigantina]